MLHGGDSIQVQKNSRRRLGKLASDFLASAGSIFTIAVLITGCCHTVYLPITKHPQLGVNQEPSTSTQPEQFYVCGNTQYPCKTTTYRWQAKPRNKSNLMINNSMEKYHEKSKKSRKCLDK